MPESPLRVFISYSHRDEALRDEFLSHMALLTRQKIIAEWFDRMITPGEDGDMAIDKNLADADVVLLLVSADFINSLYCWERELEQSLARHERKETLVVPIIVRPVDLQDVPFSSIQSLPTDRRPVTSWPNRDDAWVDVVRGLRKTFRSFQDRQRRLREGRDAEQIGHILSTDVASASPVEGLQTGYVKLDELLSSLRPSELIVVGGRLSAGKTALVTNIATNVAFNRDKLATVGLFSLETTREQLAMRIVSATSRVDINAIQTTRMEDESWGRINDAIALLRHAPIYIDDSPTLSIAELQSRATKLKRQHGLDLLVVDHLQLLQSLTAGEDQRGSAMSVQLKQLARQLGVPVIVTTQLSRKIDNRTDKRPYLGDLPDAYDLENYADVVLLMYRDETYDRNTARLGIVELEVAKQRNGPTGTIPLVFFKKYSKFDSLIPEADASFQGVDPWERPTG